MGDEGLGTVVTRVVDDARAYARAEVTLWKTVAGTRGSQAGIAAGLAVGAVVIALSAVTALLVGAILSLRPVMGPGWATLLVVVVAFGIAGILGKLAASGFKRVFAPLGDRS
ncbi:phage holin family protein [Sphingomonas sp. 2R-10]|uniref:phage holin family protein n=1 Tax=Sphingomonas sp. 2R-10 TaxID=3045148 RepID=UPI000F783523|nr:phage holin family protein [Sphingomonas sp. 2R-10]MDJ0278082.1 phage holin family protein [Sphingomonas sp. 2R-10]